MAEYIMLIGFMGSGKTTVGTSLAKALNVPFLDTDELIVKEQGIPITEIFASHGESAFRDLETKLLRRLVRESGREKPKENATTLSPAKGKRAETGSYTKKGPQISGILSVGGGLPVREENRTLMHHLGKVIFLEASIDTLAERLKGDKSRPLLAGGNPEERIKTLMEQRKSIYEEAADLRVRTDEKNPVQIAQEIIDHFAKHLR